MELLIGCGRNREKRFAVDGKAEWTDLTTLDASYFVGADVVHDLENIPYPFEDSTFDEVHAYEVLEHLGRQGDFKAYFDQFSELWRILKPGGVLCGTSPALLSPWLWGDPGHRRVISQETLTFLVQPEYAKQAGKTPMTDYRETYKADFDLETAEARGGTFVYALRAVKPSRIEEVA